MPEAGFQTGLPPGKSAPFTTRPHAALASPYVRVDGPARLRRRRKTPPAVRPDGGLGAHDRELRGDDAGERRARNRALRSRTLRCLPIYPRRRTREADD